MKLGEHEVLLRRSDQQSGASGRRSEIAMSGNLDPLWGEL